jgi:hypothetical protein
MWECIRNQKIYQKQVVAVVEALEITHHLIMNLKHQGIVTQNRGEGNVGAAGNDAKFLKFLIISSYSI